MSDKIYKMPQTVEEVMEQVFEGVLTRLEAVYLIRKIMFNEAINVVSRVCSTTHTFGNTTYVLPYSVSQEQVIHDVIDCLELERDGSSDSVLLGG